jgi:putative acyl-CoA dehydrogenase
VQALDVLRALQRQRESAEAVLREIELAAGLDARLDVYVAELRRALVDPDEWQARRLVERLALALAGSLLLRHGVPAVAEAFCATRLGREGGRSYGTLPRGVDASAIVERHRPRV